MVLAGLAGVSLLAWAYLVVTAAEKGGMTGAGAMAALRIRPWTGFDFLLTVLMWAVMMVAMMVPSAAPMIPQFATIRRRRAGAGGAFLMGLEHGAFGVRAGRVTGGLLVLAGLLVLSRA